MPARSKSTAKRSTARAKPANARKPAKSATAPTSWLDKIATYVPPPSACGPARIAPALAANERAATLLGLGYPTMLIPVDEPVPAMRGYADFKKRYLHALVVPRDLPPIMYAIVRSAPSAEALDQAVARPPKPPPLDKAVDAALRYGGARVVEIIEAMFGSEPTAQALVDALTAASVKDLNGGKYENYGYAIVYRLGALLWRVPAAVRTAHRQALAGVLDQLRAAGKLWRTGEALDVILGGRAGVERSGRGFGGQLFFSELKWADDDPAWVTAQARSILAAMKPADREVFDVQVVVAGGPETLASCRDIQAKFRKDEWSSIADQLALCAPA